MKLYLLLFVVIFMVCLLVGESALQYSKETVSEMMEAAFKAMEQAEEDMKHDEVLRAVVKRIGYDYVIDPSAVDFYVDPFVLHLWPSSETLNQWDLKYNSIAAKGGARVRWPLDFDEKELL